ncbi:endolytic transglycosylase MltG [Flexivirga alba]|uniref:Endolytic murein transglycosylase n=1 Tax=Flexivirga alba TaxID=702742 RepID=A0ABW2AL61_9MICO
MARPANTARERRAAPAKPRPDLTHEDETTEFVAASAHPSFGAPEKYLPEPSGGETSSGDGEWTGFHDWASEDDHEQHGSHTSYEEIQRHRRRRAGRSCLLLVLVMLLVVGGAGYAVSRVGRISLPGMSQSSPDYAGNGTGSVTIVVKEGDSGTSIAQTLLKAGVVKSTGAFVTAAGASHDFGSIQPGSYKLRQKMSAQSALALMLDPKSFSSTGTTIPEGLWASQIFALLSKATGVPLADYQKVTAASIGLPSAADGHLEGYLFPSTYNFGKGTTAQQQLRTMATEWRKKVAPLQIPDSQLHQVMVEASLVEAESRLAEDGPKVARVIVNRVAQGMPLQLDSTIHYAEKQRGTITTTDQQRAKKGPYNSYLNTGLPPTPINNPGLAAIKAALHPASGGWLYFVTVDPETGKTLFADTYPEQQKNEQVFHAWCQNHPGKC